MEYYILNGSPRTNWNTAKMLKKAQEGILEKLNEKKPEEEHTVQYIDLFKLDYKGCRSCFNCKVIDGPFYGTCPVNDDLKDLLPKLWDSDGLIIGSPIYLTDLTGQTRNLLERLIFAKLVYGGESLAKKKVPTAIFLTMNAPEEYYEQIISKILQPTIEGLKLVTKEPIILSAYNTVQFDDYSKYENYMFDPEKKYKYEEENFPKTLEEAYNIGAKIVLESIE